MFQNSVAGSPCALFHVTKKKPEVRLQTHSSGSRSELLKDFETLLQHSEHKETRTFFRFVQKNV